ncbi:MAG TPA: hypothetical protein VG759_28585, partial [Candidatus Angelobacter sp.]|nr:hypothetical protein [Candidatus Angelobacter sp.]
MNRIFILLAFALPILVYPQTETIGKYTQEDNDRMEKMQPRTLVAKIKNAFVFPHWIGKSDDFWYLRQTAEGTVFVIVDAATGRSHPAFDHQQLAEAVTKATGITATASHLPFDTLEFNADRSSIHIVVKDKQYDCGLKPAACSGGSPVPPEPLDVPAFISVPPPVTDPNEGLLI